MARKTMKFKHHVGFFNLNCNCHWICFFLSKGKRGFVICFHLDEMYVNIYDFYVSSSTFISDLVDEPLRCSCNFFSNKGFECCHIISYLTFNSVSELPLGWILNRWRMRDRTSHGILMEVTRRTKMNQFNVRELCEGLLKIWREGLHGVDHAMNVLNTFYRTNCLMTADEYGNSKRLINSITQFENPTPAPLQVPNPEFVRHKGCGRGGRLPKSSSRFVRPREKLLKRKIASNSRRCGQCGEIGHNKRSALHFPFNHWFQVEAVIVWQLMYDLNFLLFTTIPKIWILTIVSNFQEVDILALLEGWRNLGIDDGQIWWRLGHGFAFSNYYQLLWNLLVYV